MWSKVAIRSYVNDKRSHYLLLKCRVELAESCSVPFTTNRSLDLNSVYSIRITIIRENCVVASSPSGDVSPIVVNWVTGLLMNSVFD